MNKDIFIPMLLTLLFFMVMSMGHLTGKKEKHLTKGKNYGPAMVSGAIICSLVGGASTIGTAQLAYGKGFSAWWFTLGAGLGCLVLALFFVRPLRESGEHTLTGIIAKNYGVNTALLASILSSAGILINIITQLLAGVSILRLLTEAPAGVLTFIVASLMFFSILGGMKSAGIGGLIKTALLYVSCVGGGLYALYLGGGLSLFNHDLFKEGYFSLISRGIAKDLGSGLSLIIGVFSTQSTYLAILSGKDHVSAKKGALLSALLIPPIGIGGIIIGMYMKAISDSSFDAAYAFNGFILEYMPPVLSGIVLGALLITVIGTGASLTLGIATTFEEDLIQRHHKKPGSALRMRLFMLLNLLVASLLTLGTLGELLVDLSFMSMALRGFVLFFPILLTFKRDGRPSPKLIKLSMILGPVIMLMGHLLMKIDLTLLVFFLNLLLFFGSEGIKAIIPR